MTFEESLEHWQALSSQLKKLKTEEIKLRKALFNTAFPAPEEGVNTIELADGRLFKGTLPVTVSVDQGALTTVFEKMSDDVLLQKLFPYKYSLNKRQYNKLSDEQRKIVDEGLVTRHGTVRLDII